MANGNINRKKLKEQGVADDVIASLDPHDGGNITPTGEVLFLDEDCMKRREGHRMPFKNHPNGLGIKNWLMTSVLATTPKTWDRTLKVFMAIVSGASLTGKKGPVAELYKRVTQFSPVDKTYTHGNVLPLNISVEGQGRTTVLRPGPLYGMRLLQDQVRKRCTRAENDHAHEEIHPRVLPERRQHRHADGKVHHGAEIVGWGGKRLEFLMTGSL